MCPTVLTVLCVIVLDFFCLYLFGFCLNWSESKDKQSYLNLLPLGVLNNVSTNSSSLRGYHLAQVQINLCLTFQISIQKLFRLRWQNTKNRKWLCPCPPKDGPHLSSLLRMLALLLVGLSEPLFDSYCLGVWKYFLFFWGGPGTLHPSSKEPNDWTLKVVGVVTLRTAHKASSDLGRYLPSESEALIDYNIHTHVISKQQTGPLTEDMAVLFLSKWDM